MATGGLLERAERSEAGESPAIAPIDDVEPHRPPLGLRPRRLATAGVCAMVLWAVITSTVGRRGSVLNTAGWGELSKFLNGARSPQLDGSFLRTVGSATITSTGYAVVGTVLAMAIGVIVGAWCSETWWLGSDRVTPIAFGALRAALAVPRGIHEALWALLLVFVLARDPLVAVLAIAVPFGAISAKVVADIIDDAPTSARQAFEATRRRGAGRTSALLYTMAPSLSSPLTAYGFYRLECALRASVVLGAIGAGGLGFELALSFSGSEYGEVWTLIYVVVALSMLLDRWAAALRDGASTQFRRVSAWLIGSAFVVALGWLRVNPLALVSDRSASLARQVASEAWPPRLPTGGWSTLWTATLDTLRVSVIAIAFAAVAAAPLAFVAARHHSSPVLRAAGVGARALMAVTRAVPPTVWAVVVLFVVYPGPLAGGVALGLYTTGVLGRLFAEAVESVDARPAAMLSALGASPVAAFGYGTLPQVAPRASSLSLYRWEVAARETVVVGLVGAGGLGVLIGQQKAAFDEASMLTSIAALVVLSLAIDRVSRVARRILR